MRTTDQMTPDVTLVGHIQARNVKVLFDSTGAYEARDAFEAVKRTPLAVARVAGVTELTPISVRVLPFPVKSGQLVVVALLAS